jgi:hypothetical protein
MLARTFAVVLRQSRIHRRHLSHVGAAVVDGDFQPSESDPRLRWEMSRLMLKIQKRASRV